ncbi:stimulated by retinoic acid gene 8 protein homolog [Protopterus annectens]|uniref:stimulated by retinoic acid gene 8 protein homolog n=1 Tax=Protopterus annectens TaxID=7888 RepID=UPI001CFA5C07|nr:stimulated by retinoic acid gene 8 protein homolog [Protopterus annectens]
MILIVRYLSFYKKTVDLLIDNKIVSPEQITLPVVSKAIFYLWQDIATERNSFIFQQCNLRDTTFSPDLEFCCQVPVCVEDHMHTELQDSQEGNSSAESNSDEIFIEDAFDVASDILERGDSHAILNDSLHFSGLLSENPEGNCKLYRHIVNFIKTELCGTAASQCYNLQEAAHVDYETVMLSCTETFDDEDL